MTGAGLYAEAFAFGATAMVLLGFVFAGFYVFVMDQVRDEMGSIVEDKIERHERRKHE